MNPSVQSMKNLLLMLPSFGMSKKVAGVDLGLGRFQFDFDNEDDIVEMMKMKPLHFDHWMLSLVRWEPRIDVSYQSASNSGFVYSMFLFTIGRT